MNDSGFRIISPPDAADKYNHKMDDAVGQSSILLTSALLLSRRNTWKREQKRTRRQ
jgi:hypothetical protein